MKVQHKIVAIPLTVMLLVSSVTIFTVERYVENQLLEQHINTLRTLASASLESVKTLESINDKGKDQIIRSFQKLAENFAHVGDYRVTYLDANGTVLGDSEVGYEQLTYAENLAEKDEISLALTQGEGIAERFSTELNTDMIYVAVRSGQTHYTDNNSHLPHPIIARIGRSQNTNLGAVEKLRETLLLTGIMSLFAVLILGLIGARVMTRAIRNEQHHLEQRVIDRTTEISILRTFGGLLNACSTLNETKDVMNNIIPKLLPDYKGSISIIKSSRNRLDHLSHWGGDWPGSEHFLPSECWALRKGHQHISSEHGIQTMCSHWPEEAKQQQTICTPLLAQGETIGVLHFVIPLDSPLEQTRGLIYAIAEQVGLTLANIQLRESLREQAIRDPLTGLYNRRYMLEALEQSHSRAERNGSDIAIMMIDLDHFKLFNDNFGHDAGDLVLKAVAQVLKDSLRQEDTACRYGGEEFCIVCPAIDEQQALLISQRMADGIKSLDLYHNKMPLGTVTTSIGIAIYPKHAETIEETIQAADEALYLAKHNGRNCVEVSEKEIA